MPPPTTTTTTVTTIYFATAPSVSGCCAGGDEPLFNGVVGDLSACQRRCAELPACSAMMFGTHQGQNNWCRIISGGCEEITVEACGAGGRRLSSGMVTYKVEPRKEVFHYVVAGSKRNWAFQACPAGTVQFSDEAECKSAGTALFGVNVATTARTENSW